MIHHKDTGATTPAAAGGLLLWWLTLAAAVLGTVDVAQFLATNLSMFSAAPGRAAGSVAGLVLWMVLALGAAGMVAGFGGVVRFRYWAWVAGAVVIGSAGLALIHAAAHVGGLRPLFGVAVALLTLGLGVAAHHRLPL